LTFKGSFQFSPSSDGLNVSTRDTSGVETLLSSMDAYPFKY